ncbi:MAG: T9SS type A sorting domain-containing protein [Bacteroidales bacterium]
MKNRKLLFGLVILFLSCIGLNSVNAQTNEWISLGPDNVSGRSRTIIFDRFNNDIMYSGGVAGGLFVSVNNGKNWQEISLVDGQQNLAITAIAQDNNGVLYVGTGEGNYVDNGFGINNNTIGMLGNGVYRSTTLNASNKNWAENLTSDDAKYDWASANIEFELLMFTKPTSQYNYGDGKAFVNKIAVNRNSNKVYIGTNDGLMQINEDGAGWTMVDATGNSNIGDIVSNKNGVLAIYFTDSKANVMVTEDDFTTNKIVLVADTLRAFDTASLSINRIRLAFGNNYPNKLYSYVNYFAEGVEAGARFYREILIRSNDFNDVKWRRTTAKTYYNAGTPTSMSIAVNDRLTPEEVYLGGDYVMRGYNANNSDIYYWERFSTYTNSPNSTNGIRTSPSFVNSGINEIIIKENPTTTSDSILIVAATDGGIHTYSYNPLLFTTGWNLATKNMVTTQFYSVGVSPDGSLVGGTEANGSVYIANSGNLGENKSGDVIWTVNSPGYNPNGFQYTTGGGKVGTSQFQRVLPTQRKSLILSRQYGQIARTYGNNGDYSIIDDVTWNYGSTLFPKSLKDNIENASFRKYATPQTPMYLWETTNSQLPDSMFLVINKNTSINCVSDTTWREGSIINAGDSVLAKSPTMEYPFIYKFPNTIQYNQDTAIRIQNPIQSRLFFATYSGITVCTNISDYAASPLEGSMTPITMVTFYESSKFAKEPTEIITGFAVTEDGKTLFASSDKVSTNSDTSFLYRFDLSNVDFQNAASTITLVPDTMIFTRKISSISVDRNNGNNVVLTFGTYLSSKSNIQVSSNALAEPFSSATFKEVISLDPINDEDFLPNNKPVFCALIESVKDSVDQVAYIGTEDGIYKTTNYLGTAATGGKVEVEWEKMQGIPNVPIFQITQQTMKLPKYEFYNYVGQNSFQTSFVRTELPGAIYAASYGKGLFAYLGDTIAPNETVIGINENIAKINQTTNLRLYPNPANSSTTLEYNLRETSNVTLQVYDMNGRMVSSLDNGRQQAGQHSLQMNVQNLKGGIYMVRIITNNSTNTAKLIVR